MKTGGAERRAVGALDKRWVTTRRSSLGDFGHSRLALRREGSDRHRGCYPTDPTGEGCPSFRRDAGRSIPFGRSVLRPGAGVSSSPARRVAPVCRRGRKPTSRKAGRMYPPDLRSPSPSAGPWGNALLRRALRRSRTRPRRSPGRASSPLHAWGLRPALRPLSGGLPGRRSGTPPAQAPPLHPATDRSGSVPSWVKSERRMADIGILSTSNNTKPLILRSHAASHGVSKDEGFQLAQPSGPASPRPSRRRPQRVCSSG